MGFIYNYLRNLPSVALGRQPTRPLMFSYYVTHRCKLNCRYCSDGEGNPFKEDMVEELNTADARRLISAIARAVDTLDITGGEPLLRNDLAELLVHAKRSGLRTVLNTKGIGLEQRPDVIRNTDVMVISLDSLDITRLAALIGRPDSIAKEIFRALDYLIAKRDEFKTRVVISVVATQTNLPDVMQVMDFAGKHDLGFHVSPEIVGTMVNSELRNNPEYYALMDHVIKRKDRQRGILGVKPYLAAIRDFPQNYCYPLLMPVIRPDGRMYYPCVEKKQFIAERLFDVGSYAALLRCGIKQYGPVPECRGRCHIFCHMGLSMLQRHFLDAIGESKHWSR